MQVSDIVHHAPLGKSDHSVILFKFHSYLDYTKPKERYSYDFQAIRNHLAETKWEEECLILCCGRNKDELWNHLKLKIYDLRDQFVPKTTISGKPSWNTNGSIPIVKPVHEAIRQKTPHRRWMSTKNRTDGETTRLEYTRARNNVTRLMRKAKREFEKGICFKSKSNPKSFWWHVRHKLKTTTGVASLLEDNKDPESA